MSAETVLVIGATSSLAQALCRTLAKQKYSLVLAARDTEELQLLATDIAARFGTQPVTLTTDFLSPDFSTEQLMHSAGAFDHLIVATGDMGDSNPANLNNIAYTMWLNYTVPAQLATLTAVQLASSGKGNIVLISSVAGDRGRQSNYAYGSAKAALTGVHIMTVKPGFIDTPMTWGMQSPLIASREYVARKIVLAMQKRKNVIYVPFFWRYIMLIIIHIPEAIFKRLSL